MSRYSIKDIEHLSGIKAHTLRIWEQRFNIIQPQRTETNIRYYSDKDLRLVLNISMLRENGYKISDIVRFSHEEIISKVASVSESQVNYPDHIHALTVAMLDLDEEKFEKVMSTGILLYGFEQTIINIVYPFLNKIGILWMTGAVAPVQEHFIANLIRQKIIVAIDGQVVRQLPSSKKFILFNPEGEYHELGILFGNYILRARNHKVIYLGQSLPFEDLKFACKLHQPDYLLTSITTTQSPEEIQAYVNRLGSTFPGATILMTGFQVTRYDLYLPSNVNIIRHVNQLADLAEPV